VQQVAHQRALRETILRKLHGLSDAGLGDVYFTTRDIVSRIESATDSSVNAALNALELEGHCEVVTRSNDGDWGFRVTPAGIRRAENVILPETTPKDLPSPGSVIVFGNVSGSSIVANSVDVVIRQEQAQRTVEFIQALREAGAAVSMEQADRRDFDARLDNAEREVKAKRPMSQIIAASLNFARELLVQAGAATAVAALRSQFPEYFA